MKKYRFLIGLTISFLIFLCIVKSGETSERITNVIQERNGLAYLPNEMEPFTGLHEAFYINGQKAVSAHYKYGLGDGLVTLWYENGQKQSEAFFKYGKVDGLKTNWYENGQKQSEEELKDGKLNGVVITYYENGQKNLNLIIKTIVKTV